MKIHEVKEYKGYEYLSIEHELCEDGWDYWWCGYVKLKPDSKFLFVDYEDIPIKCHGRLTFKGRLSVMPEGEWIGFDTNHHDDGLCVKTKKYVERQCRKIIYQLIKLEEK